MILTNLQTGVKEEFKQGGVKFIKGSRFYSYKDGAPYTCFLYLTSELKEEIKEGYQAYYWEDENGNLYNSILSNPIHELDIIENQDIQMKLF